MLEKQKVKADVITALHGFRGTDQCQLMSRLAIMWLEDAREENDNAQGNEVLQNQGKITAFKMMIDAITIGVPSRQK